MILCCHPYKIAETMTQRGSKLLSFQRVVLTPPREDVRIYYFFYRFCIVSILYALKGFSLLSVINIISDVKCLD